MQETLPLIKVSNRALNEINKLSKEHNQFLRIWITKGGCAGMTYEASIDENETPFDCQLYEDNNVKIIADKNSAQHVDGLEIDFSDDLINLGFKFRNPNASKACGCGSSFAV